MEILGLVSLPGWLVSIIVVFMTVCVYTRYKQTFFKRLGIPQKPTIFFLGDVIELSKKGFGYIDYEMVKKNGKVFGLYLGNMPSLIISDADMIKQIMVKDFSKFTDRLMKPYIHKCMKTLHELLDEKIVSHPEGFDIKPLITGYTLDIICSTGFGLDIDAQKTPDNPFIKYAREFLEFKGLRRPVFVFQIFFPDIVRLFHRFLNVDLVSIESYEFYERALEHAFKERRQEQSKHRDLLELLINSHKEKGELGKKDDDSEETSFEGSKQRGLTDDEVLINCIVFMTAGYDTTATALSWVVYDLATNTDCQEKLIQEIDDEIGDSETTYDNVFKVRYLDMVINETLRVHPPATRLNRMALEDVDINGVHIKKGMDCTVSVLALHYMPEYWENPNKYDPERFAPENQANINPYAFMPFGHGPRNCVGKRLALLEVKATIVTLLQKYRFHKTDKLKVPMPVSSLGLAKPAEPVHVRLEKRNTTQA